MKRILVTGAAGYIGSVLVRQLLERGYVVRGMDILNFGGESLLDVYAHPNFEFFRGDIRDIKQCEAAIKNVDDIIHLAAIVGDPACAAQPDIARETNWEASRALFDLAESCKTVNRFIFASTCSNYGKMEGDGFVSETSPLRPVSLYAELKVKFEKYLLESKTGRHFVPTALRFATVYGISSRMRFDLTINEFVRDVAMGRELVIYGEQFWRPYCHVNDLARACVMVLESLPEKVDHEVFGVGDTRENYQKKMIAEEILRVAPAADIRYVHKDEDPRDYRVNFSKIARILNFKVTKRVPDGIREIHRLIKDGLISDPFSSKYRNI